jgi:hypothetical protein
MICRATPIPGPNAHAARAAPRAIGVSPHISSGRAFNHPARRCASRSVTPPSTERPAQPLTVEDRPITGPRSVHRFTHAASRLLLARARLDALPGRGGPKAYGAPGDLYVYADGRLITSILLAPHALARSHHPLRTGPTSCCVCPLGDLIQGDAQHGGQPEPRSPPRTRTTLYLSGNAPRTTTGS